MQKKVNYVIIILIRMIKNRGETMNIEIKIDENYTTPKAIIYTDKISKEISNIVDSISSIDNKNLNVYKDDKLYILNQDEIETIYSQNGKVYVRYNQELYTVKKRLYELELFLDKKIFVRISNSEIVNFNKVKNIDFKMIGTMILNFNNGNKSYVSRRYIPKIKEFLEI